MRRVWTIIGLIAAVALLAGVILLVSTTTFELSVREYDDPAAEATFVSAQSMVASPVVLWLGRGLVALFVAAIGFTIWAVVKQVRLIRRGRPDSR